MSIGGINSGTINTVNMNSANEVQSTSAQFGKYSVNINKEPSLSGIDNHNYTEIPTTSIKERGITVVR